MLADFEQQIGAIYDWDNDDSWREIAKEAHQQIVEANEKIAQRCQELGIPKAFRPAISASWYGRNESAVQSRRIELRRMAKTQIDAIEQGAKVKIELVSIQAQTEILSNGMSSPSAIEFLNKLPPIDALMPPLDFKLIEKLTGKTYESDAADERKVVQLRLVHGDKDDKREKPDDPQDVAQAQPEPTPMISQVEDVASLHDKHELADKPPHDPGLTP